MYKFFVILLLLITCSGCAFMIAKETAKVIDTVLEGEPNPTKKEKILVKQNKIKQKAREFYCSKVHDKEKCDD